MMSDRGRVTRIMCINCNICVNTLRRYRALELDIKVTTLLCSWVYPQIITEDDYICEACKDLAISVNHSLQEISGIDDQQPGPSHQGHASVCLLCGCSTLRRQSDRILRDNPTDLHQLMFTIIENRVAPRQVTETDKVCHPCWLRTQREARRTYDVNRPQSATEESSTADMPIVAEVQPSVTNEEDTHHDRLDTRTDSGPSLLAKLLSAGLDAAPPNTTEQDSSTNILLMEADVINIPTIEVSQSSMPRAHVVPSTPPRVGSPVSPMPSTPGSGRHLQQVTSSRRGRHHRPLSPPSQQQSHLTSLSERFLRAEEQRTEILRQSLTKLQSYRDNRIERDRSTAQAMQVIGDGLKLLAEVLKNKKINIL